MSRKARYAEIERGLSRYSMNARLEFRQEGNWLGVQQFFNEAPALVTSAAYAGQIRAAQMFYDVIMEAFDSGGSGYGWAPLKSGYSTWKEKHYSGQPLMTLTGAYRDSIEITENKMGHRVYVGIDPDAISRRSKTGFLVSEYARVMETGSISRGVPARPLWGPSFRKFGGRKKVALITATHIQAALTVNSPVEVRIR